MSSDLTVLLVDDQVIVAEAVRQMLQAEDDLILHHCAHAERAVFLARAVRPSVILQDLLMPGMDGFQLVRAYRAEPDLAGVPVIILSTREDPSEKSKAFADGASDYLVKLPDKIELVARIRAHARSYLAQVERDAAYKELEKLKQQLEEQNAQLEQMSVRDGLTGVANRRHFDDRLDRAWRRSLREGSPLSLVMIDVDHFKLYNDLFGHPGGDDCLRAVAKTLAAQIQRPDDLIARYGGEEFAAILPVTDGAGAGHIAEQMRAAVSALQMAHPRSSTGHVTISVGVGTMRASSSETMNALIELADSRLYEAKRGGRDRVIAG